MDNTNTTQPTEQQPQPKKKVWQKPVFYMVGTAAEDVNGGPFQAPSEQRPSGRPTAFYYS